MSHAAICDRAGLAQSGGDGLAGFAEADESDAGLVVGLGVGFGLARLAIALRHDAISSAAIGTANDGSFDA